MNADAIVLCHGGLDAICTVMDAHFDMEEYTPECLGSVQRSACRALIRIFQSCSPAVLEGLRNNARVVGLLRYVKEESECWDDAGDLPGVVNKALALLGVNVSHGEDSNTSGSHADHDEADDVDDGEADYVDDDEADDVDEDEADDDEDELE